MLSFSEMVSAWEHATNSSENEGFDDSEGGAITCCAASDRGCKSFTAPTTKKMEFSSTKLQIEPFASNNDQIKYCGALI